MIYQSSTSIENCQTMTIFCLHYSVFFTHFQIETNFFFFFLLIYSPIQGDVAYNQIT
jgi:hypothetical protein